MRLLEVRGRLLIVGVGDAPSEDYLEGLKLSCLVLNDPEEQVIRTSLEADVLL